MSRIHGALEPPVTPGAPASRILQHPIGEPAGNYQWVLLWQLPIRAMHWIAAISVITLAFTGFYLGRPFFLPQGMATGAYSFQWARLIHFLAAAAVAITALVRIYWLAAGNRYERFPALFPIRPRDWANLWRQVKYYGFMDHDEPHYVGHNPLQQLFYTSVYMAALVMVLTGFAMYGTAEPQGIIYRSFQWVTDLFGGLPRVRLVHHVLTWYFLVFVVSHVYFAIRSDVVDLGGGMSSIFSGGKFVRRDVDYVDIED